MKRTTLSTLLLYLTGIIYAQSIQISGCVIDNEKNILQAATIRCFTNDSIFVKGTTTNNQGHFNIDLPETKQKYQIKINYMGYKELIVNLNPTTEKRAQLGDVELKKDAVQIAEVTILGNQMVRNEDKLMVFPTKQQLRHAYDGYSALTTLMIPGLDTDPFSKSVNYYGQGVLLLINGRESTREEINNLNAKDIIRIDFYDQSHPEYPMAESVLNYILKKRDYGGTMTFNGQQHLNKATGDYRGSAQFYQKKSELAVSIADGYNHYRCNSNSHSTTEFDFPDGILTNTQNALPSLAESNDLRTYMNYIYKEKKQSLYVSLRLNRGLSDNNNQSSQLYSNKPEEQLMQDKSHSNNLNPGLQLQYDLALKNDQKLRVKWYSSYGNNKYNRHYHSNINEDVISDYSNRTKEDSWYLNPSITYSKIFKNKSSFSMQLLERYTNTHTKYNSEGTLTDAYYTSSCSYLFASHNYRIHNKFRIETRMGLQLIYLDNRINSSTDVFYYPSVKTTYMFNQRQQLIFGISMGSGDPTLSTRTTAEQRIDDYQVRRGNPDLPTRKIIGSELGYKGDFKRINIMAALKWQCVTDTYYHDVEYDATRNIYVHSFGSGGNNHTLSPAIITQFQIIPKKLILALRGSYSWNSESIWEKFNYDIWIGNAQLTFMHKNWMVRTNITSGHEGFNGGTWEKIPVQYNFNASYNTGNWNFSFGSRNPFTNSINRRKYQYNGYKSISYSSAPRINDDVFYVNINYRFNFGKKHKFDNTEVQDINQTTILKAKD